MYLDQHYPQYFTSTCLEWNYLLKQDSYKDKNSKDLKWLVDYHWSKVYAFVIMPNHLHYIGHVHPTLNYGKVKGGHLRNTSQKIKHHLLQNKEEKLLSQFYVGAKDRAYQYWERNPLSVDLYTPKVMYQKMDYSHNNPLQGKWNLCQSAKGYRYSSAE